MTKKGMLYQSKSTLNAQSLEQLKWWLENIQLYNGKDLQPQTHVLLQTSASQKGWKASSQGISTGGVDEKGVETSHKCSKTFCSEVSPAHIHQGKNNQVNSLPDR